MTKETRVFQWLEGKYYYETGTEMFGKEFFARVTTQKYLTDYDLDKYSFVVLNEDSTIYHESPAEFDSVEEAKMQAEELLDCAVKDFARKIGYFI